MSIFRHKMDSDHLGDTSMDFAIRKIDRSDLSWREKYIAVMSVWAQKRHFQRKEAFLWVYTAADSVAWIFFVVGFGLGAWLL